MNNISNKLPSPWYRGRWGELCSVSSEILYTLKREKNASTRWKLAEKFEYQATGTRIIYKTPRLFLLALELNQPCWPYLSYRLREVLNEV
jgi:hypothetical protein